MNLTNNYNIIFFNYYILYVGLVFLYNYYSNADTSILSSYTHFNVIKYKYIDVLK